MSKHLLPPTPPKTPRKSPRSKSRSGDDATNVSMESKSRSGDDDTDVSIEDFTEVLGDQITAYHVVKYKAKEGETKQAILNRKVVRKFLNKAEIRFLGCSRVSSTMKQDSKRLRSRRSSVFKNKTKEKIKHTFRKTAEDTVTAQLKVTEGFTLGVMAGLSGGPPGGGLTAGGGASYSRNSESSSGSSLTTTMEMEAEVNVPAGHVAVATELEYHTVYLADCEFDFAVDESHEIDYRWEEKTQKTKAVEPKKCRIGSKFSRVLEKIAYWDPEGKRHYCLKTKELPLVEECKQDIVQASKKEKKKVHFPYTFLSELTAIQHELEVTVSPDDPDPVETEIYMNNSQ